MANCEVLRAFHTESTKPVAIETTELFGAEFTEELPFASSVASVTSSVASV